MAIFLRIGKHLFNAAGICLLLFFFARASESGRHPFNPELLSSKSYSEIYTLTTLYNDQTFIQIQMVVSNIGLCDGNAACEMLVLHSGEKSKKTFKRFKKVLLEIFGYTNPSLVYWPVLS